MGRNLPASSYTSSSVKIAPVSVASNGESLEVGSAIHVAGEDTGDKLVADDPIWTSNDTVLFFHDPSGYLNPWKFVLDKINPDSGTASPLLPEPAKEEFGPSISFLNRHCSGALGKNLVACHSFREGRSTLHIFDISKGTHEVVPTKFAHILFLHGGGTGLGKGGKVVF